MNGRLMSWLRPSPSPTPACPPPPPRQGKDTARAQVTAFAAMTVAALQWRQRKCGLNEWPGHARERVRARDEGGCRAGLRLAKQDRA